MRHAVALLTSLALAACGNSQPVGGPGGERQGGQQGNGVAHRLSLIHI